MQENSLRMEIFILYSKSLSLSGFGHNRIMKRGIPLPEIPGATRKERPSGDPYKS